MLRISLGLVLLSGCIQQQPEHPRSSSPALTEEQAAAERAQPYNEGLALVARLDAVCQTKPIEERIEKLRVELLKTRELEDISKMYGQFNAEEYRQYHTELSFELARKALSVGCIEIADQTYRGLVEFYQGAAYQGIRDRAKIGIDDVRAARRQ